MAAAVQPNGLGNSQKTVYKTFWTSGRPTQDKPNRINIAKEEIDEDGVFVVYSFFSIAKPSLTSFFSDSDEITKLWNLHWHKLTDALYWWCWMFSFSLALLPPAGLLWSLIWTAEAAPNLIHYIWLGKWAIAMRLLAITVSKPWHDPKNVITCLKSNMALIRWGASAHTVLSR